MAINKEIHNFGFAAEERFGFAQSVKVGDTIWLAGQVGPDAEGRYGTLEEQIRNTYGYIRQLLGMHGADLSNVVDEVIYRTDHSKEFTVVASRLRKEFYGGTPQVCCTLVNVPSIGNAGCQLEVKVVAKL